MTDAVTASSLSSLSTTTSSESSETAEATATISSDFDTFLTLMTAQLENQDPLNPMDSAEFSTQLATFAGVEQQALTNEYLVDLTNSIESLLGSSGLSAYSDWIGKEVLATGPTYFDGVTPKSLEFFVPVHIKGDQICRLC
ncbi:MAG: flagellar hook capping FlgD N-terminal domain-containing protein, partial [Pseudomonadota bacterium]